MKEQITAIHMNIFIKSFLIEMTQILMNRRKSYAGLIKKKLYGTNAYFLSALFKSYIVVV